MDDIITIAINNRQKCLSEYDSKKIVKNAGIMTTKEQTVQTAEEAVKISEETGYPVVLKACSHKLTHKTGKGLIHLNLKNSDEVLNAFNSIREKNDDHENILVQEMIDGDREFVIGFHRDPHFGPCVMFGLGGIYAEELKDTVFRIAPLTKTDAEEMLDEINAKPILGKYRGYPAVNRSDLVTAILGVGKLGVEDERIAEIDINPLIISGDKPIAVDSLVVLKNGNGKKQIIK